MTNKHGKMNGLAENIET